MPILFCKLKCNCKFKRQQLQQHLCTVPSCALMCKPLMLLRSPNRTDSPIYKPKTVVEGSAYVRDNVSIPLNSEWIQDGMIPGCDYETMQIVHTVKYNVRYHAQHKNWLCKPANHVVVTTWICQPAKKKTSQDSALWAP